MKKKILITGAVREYDSKHPIPMRLTRTSKFDGDIETIHNYLGDGFWDGVVIEMSLGELLNAVFQTRRRGIFMRR